MVSDSLDRLLAERSFEYGPTTVEVEVRIVRKAYNTPKYGAGVSPYQRRVSVEAVGGEYDGDDNRVENVTSCEIVVEQRIPRGVQFLSVGEEIYGLVAPWKSVPKMRSKRRDGYAGEMVPTGPAVSVTKQVEETVRPVLEQLDVHYNLVGMDIDVDIDVTMEYLECETSLAEVDEEIASFASQLERNGASRL